MKKNYLKSTAIITMLLLLCCGSLFSQTVFDWETAVDNGATVSQTKDGIIATVSVSSGDADIIAAGGFAGSTGNIIYDQIANASNAMTISFSTAVNISSIFAFDSDAAGGSNWTFTPTGGSNAPKTEPISASVGKTVILDWNDVTSVTITSSQGNESFAIDDITLSTFSCNEPDIPSLSATSTNICSGGNTDLFISGNLNDATNWHIYSGSCGGTQIGSTTNSTFNVSPTATTTYFIRGEGGCVTPGSCGSITVLVNNLDDASFSYGASAYCVDASDPSPTITGLSGGSFSNSPAGLSINPVTGAIDVSASTPGTYTVTYTTAGACPNASNASLTINALDDASFSYSASAYCVDAADPTPTITGLAGGMFSNSPAGLSINPATGAIDVSASTPGTYTVTYTTAGACPNASNASLTINALDDASFSYSASAYCVDASDPSPTIIGLAGGMFSNSPAGLSINPATGAIDVSASTPGTYTVTYTTAGACPNASNASLTINALDDASFSYSASAYCVDAADPTPTITGLAGGMFSNSPAGLSINPATGAIDVSASTPGTYTVTYTTAGACPNASNASLTINALDDASFSYNASAYCVDAADPTPTITGLAGGMFSNSPAGLSINPATGAIDVSASTPGTYTVTYTTAGACPNASTASLTINALDDASFSYADSVFTNVNQNTTPTVVGLSGGTFSSTAGLAIDPNTGVIDLENSTIGSYTVTYTTIGNCPNSSTFNVTLDAALSQDLNSSLEHLRITVNQNSLIVNGLHTPKATLQLYTIYGKRVVTKTLRAKGNHNLQLPQLPKGIYISILETSKGQRRIDKILLK